MLTTSQLTETTSDILLSDADKKIILGVVGSGEFPRLSQLKVDLSSYRPTAIIRLLRGTDQQKTNFRMAEGLTNQLLSGGGNLRRSIVQLLALELNQYDNHPTDKKRFQKRLSNYFEELHSFPEKKRVVKFLVRFTRGSRALRETVNPDEKNLVILKIYNQINSEVSKPSNYA